MMDGFRELISAEQIRERITGLAEEIVSVYGDSPLVLISVLKGAFVFKADLMRALPMETEIGFLMLSSYKGEMTRQTEVQQVELPLPDIRSRDVLIVEDILDTGASLMAAVTYCRSFQPASLRVCTLLHKQNVPGQVELAVDFTGFRIENRFVVGYGLDYRERFRQLPCIAVVDDPSILE